MPDINYGAHLRNSETDALLAKWSFADVRLEMGTDILTRLDTSRATGHMRARKLVERMNDVDRRSEALARLDVIEAKYLAKMAKEVSALLASSKNKETLAHAEKWLEWYQARQNI